MITLEDIKRPVAEEVDNFHQQFDAILATKSEWLSSAIEHLGKSLGKMVRPILTTLVAGMLAPTKPRDKAVDAAILLELIHTATLIHDDVIDEAQERRGRPTLNALFDNRIAVLMGDFILSSALIGAISTKDLRIISVVSAIGRELTEGEIRQYETASRVVLSEEVYMDVIQQKTAALFEACAEVAAISMETTEELSQRVIAIAGRLGLAFQIRDDIFDYYQEDVGKPTGNDIREGKVTLPLLHALLEDGGKSEQGRACLELLERKELSEQAINSLLSFAHERGGIDYAHTKIEQLIEEAKSMIRSFAPSVYRTALLELADFIMLRKY